MGIRIYPLQANCRYCNAIIYRRSAIYLKNKETRGIQVECFNCGARGGLFRDENAAWLGFAKGDPVQCTT